MSVRFRPIISLVVTAIICGAGGVIIWQMARQPGANVARASVGMITANVAAITDVIQSPAYARVSMLAPAVKPATMGNPNPFPGPKED